MSTVRTVSHGRLPQALCLSSFIVLVVNYYLQSPYPGWVTGAIAAAIDTTWLWMVMAVLVRKDRRNMTWILLTAGIGAFAIAGTMNLVYIGLHSVPPYPGPPDVLFFLIYPCAGTGLFLLARGSRGTSSLAELVGSSVLLAAVAGEVLTWPAIWVPIIDSRMMSLSAKIVSLAYPALDLIILSVAIAVFLMLNGRNDRKPQRNNVNELIMIVAGLIGILASDTLYNYISLRWSWDQPSWVDIGWLSWFLLWALAALEPAKTEEGNSLEH